MKYIPRCFPRQFVELLMILLIITLLFNSFVTRKRNSTQLCSKNDVIINKELVANNATLEDCHPVTTQCQEVDLVLLIWNADEAREASGLIKTVLHHRTQPLHIHFLVNALTHPIILTLMQTWELVEVRYTLYQLDMKHSERQQWLMTRFTLLNHIPNTIGQVVYLDNAMRLTADIASLTKQIDGHSQYTVAMVPMSCDSADKKQQLDCFWASTSVMVFNRKRIQESAQSLGLLSAKTQEDIQSVLLKLNSEMYPIPCSWQVQLMKNFDYLDCLKNDTVKGVVWTGSAVEFYTNNIDVEVAKESVFSVMRSAPSVNDRRACSTLTPQSSSVNKTAAQIDVTDRCAMFRYAVALKRRTHLYYLADAAQFDKKAAEKDEVTLMVQLSVDRFTVLERILANWKGPASIVFHASDEEVLTLTDRVKMSSVLGARQGVAYHVVYKRQYYNPINYLRNVALNNSRTPYALSLDVDLVPNPGLYESIKKNLAELAKTKSKEVLVVAAFEVETDPGEQLPKSKEEMLIMLKNDKISGYSMKRGWNLGHNPTNYPLWQTSTVTYNAIFHDAYEPYVVVPTNIHPRYHEGLLERMGDKIAYGRQLHAEGFGFRVLNEDFVIHIPHPKSMGTMRYGKDPNLYHCGSVFFEKFRRELAAQYPDRKF